MLAIAKKPVYDGRIPENVGDELGVRIAAVPTPILLVKHPPGVGLARALQGREYRTTSIVEERDPCKSHILYNSYGLLLLGNDPM